MKGQHTIVILSEAKDRWFSSDAQRDIQRCFASLNMTASSWPRGVLRVSLDVET
jgi:hypothetical protein